MGKTYFKTNRKKLKMDKAIYVIAKIFDQQGCIAYRCKTINEARCLPGTLQALCEEGVQIVILDEPEIHLHPEWQLVFAELIVLIHKEFGIHVLLNTHSPYFLNAIEVYAVKHGIDDKCKYYLASSNAEVSNIEDVTNNIEAIYSKLARPLQDLENERGQL